MAAKRKTKRAMTGARKRAATATKRTYTRRKKK